MNKTDLDNKLTNFNDESQNRFAYQPTLDTLELKKDKGTDYVHGSKSKWVYNSKLKPLYTALLDSIKLFEYKMEKKIEKDPLAVEQSNYFIKIVNVYIDYDLDAWNFTLKKLFAWSD